MTICYLYSKIGSIFLSCWNNDVYNIETEIVSLVTQGILAVLNVWVFLFLFLSFYQVYFLCLPFVFQPF